MWLFSRRKTWKFLNEIFLPMKIFIHRWFELQWTYWNWKHLSPSKKYSYPYCYSKQAGSLFFIGFWKLVKNVIKHNNKKMNITLLLYLKWIKIKTKNHEIILLYKYWKDVVFISRKLQNHFILYLLGKISNNILATHIVEFYTTQFEDWVIK